LISKLIDILYSILQSCYSAITDTGYIDFNNSGDGTMSFTGLTGKITLASDADVKVSFDSATDANSLVIQGGEQPVTIDRACKTLYVKGVSGSGNLTIITQNLGTGKSDDEIRLEDRMNRKI